MVPVLSTQSTLSQRLDTFHIMHENLLRSQPHNADGKGNACKQVKTFWDHAEHGGHHRGNALTECFVGDEKLLAEEQKTDRNDQNADNLYQLVEGADHLGLFALFHGLCLECRLTYRVFGDGSIQTTLTYDPVKELGDMPEFGVMFKLDADYDNVTWYGMGPEETYVDRCAGAKLGVYKNKVEDNMAKYLVPQECGNKVGVRWATVTNRKGRGMMFSGDKMEFSALPYTPHELENAMHPYELPQVHYTVVRVAKQQMGVGGDDSWGAQTHPEYLIPIDKKLEFTFTFKGI